MSYEVGDAIEVRIDEGGDKTQVYSGVILKVVYSPPPAWANRLPGYTLITYRMANGQTNVVSGVQWS